ncbi:MAG: LysM peptidoglycan-binding domain-containing protein [Fuerstia sp.]|nr:LysM peptidoglycan-binding domain-containing protein [Fuerstiella sp.]
MTDSSSLSPESIPAFADIEEEPLAGQAEAPTARPNSTEVSFDPAAEEPSFSGVAEVREPVLLAMAEPQQSDGFGTGFPQDDSGATAKAPPEEPADFSSSFPAMSDQSIESSPQKQNSDSRGFNAVKNPGGRKPGNSIRTAAGLGSDGKFSLAAFNYQNGASHGAPDDGSTFDSVVVQNGDNYTKISKRVYGTVKYFSALAVFNQHRISEPKNMRPGMVVLVPAKEVLEERYPEFFVDSQPKIQEPAEFLILEDGTPAYRVGERETISEISARFLGRSSRWIEIYRLNQSIVKDPNKLKAGLILALPADAAEVNVVP